MRKVQKAKMKSVLIRAIRLIRGNQNVHWNALFLNPLLCDIEAVLGEFASCILRGLPDSACQNFSLQDWNQIDDSPLLVD